MTFLEALYGSQYAEINGRGGDTSKGRMNGNLFLSAFAIICLFIVLAVLFKLGKLVITAPEYMSGKALGKILAVPLMAAAYFSFNKTIGSEENYNNYVKRYADCSDAEKAGANKQVLVPFFIALGILMLLMFV